MGDSIGITGFIDSRFQPALVLGVTRVGVAGSTSLHRQRAPPRFGRRPPSQDRVDDGTSPAFPPLQPRDEANGERDRPEEQQAPGGLLLAVANRMDRAPNDGNRRYQADADLHKPTRRRISAHRRSRPPARSSSDAAPAITGCEIAVA